MPVTRRNFLTMLGIGVPALFIPSTHLEFTNTKEKPRIVVPELDDIVTLDEDLKYKITPELLRKAMNYKPNTSGLFTARHLTAGPGLHFNTTDNRIWVRDNNLQWVKADLT